MDVSIVTLMNIGVELWGGVFCIVCFICSSTAPHLSQKQRRYTMALFGLCALCLLGDAASYHGDGVNTPLGRVELMTGTMVSNFFSPPLTYMYIKYMLSTFNPPESRFNFWRKTFQVITIALMALTLITPFTGILYTIDAANVYHRTPLTWMHHGLLVAMAIVAWISLTIHRKEMPRQTFWTMTAATAFPVAGGIAILFSYGIAFGYIAFTFTSIIVFMDIQFLAARSYVETEHSLAENRAKVLISQIQPEYTFETLNVIQYLCRTDPKRARKAVTVFGTFLRGSINAMKSEDLIPFEKELDQVEAYLELEQLNTPNLKVLWDVQVTDFKIPPLTLQAIVENAVVMGIHGCEKEDKGLFISTSEVDGGIEMVLEDTGRGFEPGTPPPADSSIPYAAIEQSRARLRHLLGGTITLEGHGEDGVTTRVFIPAAAKAS